MKAQTALSAAVKRLAAVGHDNAAREARLLLAYAMGIAPDRLTLHLADDLQNDAASRFDAAIAARLAHQPVAQITGRRLFWGHSFRVTRDTLDPRPETETLVAAALSESFGTILDLGTGTGCIVLSCLADMPGARGIGADLSPVALDVAQANARDLGLQDRVQFVQSDWFQGVTGQFDLIVSNPPYIGAAEMAGLSVDVRDWEPHLALSPGGDGLDPYRAITRQAPAHLLPGGRLIFEIGPTQASAVSKMMADQGFAEIRVIVDMDGRDRVVLGRK